MPLRPRRRGSAYIGVLMLATLLTVLALASITAGRVGARTLADSADWAAAQALAASGADHAQVTLANTPDWRSALAGRTIERTLARGRFSWQLTDDDGSLTDDPRDDVTLTVVGAAGEARHTLALRLVMDGAPLLALRGALTAAGDVTVAKKAELTLKHAPLYCNSDVVNAGKITGDIQSKTLGGKGTHKGDFDALKTPLAMPAADVFDSYKAQATALPKMTQLHAAMLSPRINPWGEPNDKGIYYIDTGGKDLTIQLAAVRGTLVVKAGGGTVTVEGATFLKAYRSDQPVLLVDGNLELAYDSRGNGAGWGLVNGKNGKGWDSRLPGIVSGLVHVRGDVTMKDSARVHGAIIAEGSVDIRGDNEIFYKPRLANHPPEGYADGTGAPRATTWTRQVE